MVQKGGSLVRLGGQTIDEKVWGRASYTFNGCSICIMETEPTDISTKCLNSLYGRENKQKEEVKKILNNSTHYSTMTGGIQVQNSIGERAKANTTSPNHNGCVTFYSVALIIPAFLHSPLLHGVGSVCGHRSNQWHVLVWTGLPGSLQHLQ